MKTLGILPILHNHRHPKYYCKKKDKLTETTNFQKAVTFQTFRNTGHKSTFISFLLQRPNLSLSHTHNTHTHTHKHTHTHTHTHTHILSRSHGILKNRT
jgi:hypothetical protein